jgi:hypothetical protein
MNHEMPLVPIASRIAAKVNKGKGKSDKDAVATTPAEESKGKPKVAE